MNAAGLRLGTSSRAAVRRWTQRRDLHTRKELPYNIDNGLGHFMSPRTLRMVAVEYQQGLLDRLNEQCRDVDDRRKTVAQLVLDTARSQDRAVTFKHASHALNNSFFLHSLRPPSPASEKRVDASVLGAVIQKQFGGLDALRGLFSAAANGMAGSGYVWFVTDAHRNLAFVPTFASGTLLIRSGSGTVDPITTPVLGEQTPSSLDTPATDGAKSPPRPDRFSPVRLLGTRDTYRTHARAVYDPSVSPLASHGPQNAHDLSTLGEYIYPLFCISVHEHCWLLDHGVWGKEQYLREFWTVVDWDQVVKRFETFTGSTI